MIAQQQTFDAVVTHQRSQGRKSLRTLPNGKLKGAYRSPEGLACAGGCVIPDRLYDPRMETEPVSPDDLAAKVLVMLGHDLECVRGLQGIHDCAEVDDWEYCWRMFAGHYGLKYAPPSESLRSQLVGQC